MSVNEINHLIADDLPLPAGLTTVGGSIDLEGYSHPLPAGLTLGLTECHETTVKVCEHVLKRPDDLEMSDWHNDCGTKHCLAGWAVTIHPRGKELEKHIGTAAAATVLCPKLAPMFYKTCKDERSGIFDELRRIAAGKEAS